VARPVYGRDYAGQPVFYERHYDAATLRSRLITKAKAKLVNIELWGERIPGERFLGWNRQVRKLLSPLEPLLAVTSLRLVEEEAQAKAAFITLVRV
jgi:hypothetical protein